MTAPQTIQEIISGWDRDDGTPYKGGKIDLDAYAANPKNMGCMCAQAQVLFLTREATAQEIAKMYQTHLDMLSAKKLNISRAHSILLRIVNDKPDGIPSIVLTDPGKVLGNQWNKLLDMWWLFDNYTAGEWRNVIDARNAARDVVGVVSSARNAAREAVGEASARAAWSAAGGSARDASGGALWPAAREAAEGASSEIQGHKLMVERDQKPFFLPMFGFATPADIPPRPANYGNLYITPETTQ